MPKVNSGRKLVKLMHDHGSRGTKMEVLKQPFPKDKHGKPVKDVHADVLVEHLKEYMEEHPGEIPDLTLEKLVSLRQTGEWTPVVTEVDNMDGPVEFEDTPDDVVKEKTESKSDPVKVKEDTKKEKKDK